MVLGLSDHTPGHSTVLGAVALGARVIEKHFTDDNSRKGPDHPFSMNPNTWKEMVVRSRELETALGNGMKRVEDNERDTYIIQRRCIRINKDLEAGSVVNEEDLEFLRPAPKGAILPYDVQKVLGKVLSESKSNGDALYETDLVN
ncbi:N,N'-diacetyllegionaminic acid synthase [compost metagenome]